MEYIYILSEDGRPLMPTVRKNHVQKLLKRGKARVVEHVPFVVQLRYKKPGITQPLFGGTDPGRTNIGNAVMDGRGNVVYKDHVTMRNKEIAKLMAARRGFRQASRRGERLARKRIANRLGTTVEGLMERILPGCKEPVRVKDIINTEARFNNRKRPKGWVTPSVRHLILTHVNMIRRIRKFLPVDSWTLEVNKFAFMQLDDGSVVGTDFQNGKLRSYEDVNDYIWHLQGGKCLRCGKNEISHYHHILPRHKDGSDRWYNIAGLCKSCHDSLHKREFSLDTPGGKKRYAGTSVLNQAMPFIAKELEGMFPMFDTCTGKDTHDIRELLSIGKTHADDAVCVAAYGAPVSGIRDGAHTYEVLQFRRHDRANIKAQRERTYYMADPATGTKRAVAKNRRPRYEQQGPALSTLNLTRQEVSQFTVKKSTRYYNDPGRLMPGAEFLYGGERYVMTGQLTGGKYLRAAGQGKKNFPVAKCRVIRKNRGLVYAS